MIVFFGMLLGTAAALVFPEWVLWMKGGLRPAFAVTMFFVGTLVKDDEVRAFRSAPLRPVSGLISQYTVMPLLAFVVSLFFESPTVKVGIVLVGCMPGAMASNVMTVLLKGDLVLSVTMTTLATLLCPLMIGFWLPILSGASMGVSVLPMVLDTIWMVLLPVLVGALLRHRIKRLPQAWDTVATAVASVSIVLIILVVFAANRDRLAAMGPGLAAAMLGFNLAAYAVAFGVGTLLKWPPMQRKTLVIEVGMQNAGLGSVLALSHLGPEGAVPSAFYTGLCVLTAAAALPFAKLRRGAQY